MSYTAQPDPNCLAVCPVIEQDRISLENMPDNDMAKQDFERHCAQSVKCGGAVVNMTDFATIVKCPMFHSSSVRLND